MDNQNTLKDIKKKLGVRLFAIALFCSLNTITKKEIEKKIKECKGRKKMPIKQAKELIEIAAEDIREMRKERQNRRNKEKTGKKLPALYPLRKNQSRKDPLVGLDLKTRGEIRLENLLKSKMETAGYRVNPSGDCIFTVKRVEGASYAKGFSQKGESYSKTCTYQKTDAYFSFFIQEKSRPLKLLNSDMAIVDGLLNIQVTQIDENVWKAVWLKQERGFKITSQSGFICYDNRVGYAHGSTIKGAKATIEKRVNAKKIEKTLELIKQRLENWQIDGFKDLEIDFKDSIAAGNCETGTKNWIEKHFPGRQKGTIKEVLAVQDQRRQVLAACLHAIHRQYHEINEDIKIA